MIINNKKLKKNYNGQKGKYYPTDYLMILNINYNNTFDKLRFKFKISILLFKGLWYKIFYINAKQNIYLFCKSYDM